MGLTRAATGDEVKAAFRRLAREVHPDVSKLPKAEAEKRFKMLLDAYNRIKVANGW
ncbi:MAG: J domain-containing protein [Chloroflexi bacterium]|nr:J domain-containing protein [Chloroflexota bacterium]